MGIGTNIRIAMHFHKKGQIMSEETKDKKPKAPIDFSSIGGRKVGHPVPVKGEKPIDFSSIGGKCILKASEHPVFSAKPEEKDDKAHAD
jgi:hypothetical protein